MHPVNVHDDTAIKLVSTGCNHYDNVSGIMHSMALILFSRQ